jgi:hypothetical protein
MFDYEWFLKCSKNFSITRQEKRELRVRERKERKEFSGDSFFNTHNEKVVETLEDMVRNLVSMDISP